MAEEKEYAMAYKPQQANKPSPLYNEEDGSLRKMTVSVAEKYGTDVEAAGRSLEENIAVKYGYNMPQRPKSLEENMEEKYGLPKLAPTKTFKDTMAEKYGLRLASNSSKDEQQSESNQENELDNQLDDNKKEEIEESDFLNGETEIQKENAPQLTDSKQASTSTAPDSSPQPNTTKTATPNTQAPMLAPKVSAPQNDTLLSTNSKETTKEEAPEESASEIIVPQVNAVKIDLAAESKKAISISNKKINTQASAQKKTENTEKKASQIKKSLVTQPEEMQAKANASLVAGMKSVSPNKPSASDGKRSLQQGMRSSLPKTVKDVKEFRSRGTARQMTASMKSKISSQSGEVTGAFGAIKNQQTPDPAPASEPLPSMEPSAAEKEGIGKGLVPSMTEKHLDMQAYAQAGQSIIEQAGINKEAVKELGDTPLALMVKDLDALESQNVSQRDDILSTAQGLSAQADQELEQMSKDGQKKIIDGRKRRLGNVSYEQKTRKGSLEAQKKQATEHIEGIFGKAKKTVEDKLKILNGDSMKKFEARVAKAEAVFSANVERKQEAISTKYYEESNAIVDWWRKLTVSIEDVPGMSAMFAQEKARFESSVNQAIAEITASNQSVIDECKDIIRGAHEEIDIYQKSLPEAVRTGIGESAAAIRKQLKALSAEVNTQAAELKKTLAEKQKKAVEKVQAKIDKIIEENKSLLDKAGDMAEKAVMLFAQELFEKIGVDPKKVISVFEKGKGAVQAFFADPAGFIKNVLSAVSAGVGNFKDNIQGHLKEGFLGWLTGATGKMSINMPEQFNLQGIFDLALQVMGLGWEQIKAQIIAKGGPKVAKGIEMAEQSIEIIKQVREGGLVVLWDMLKEKAEEVKVAFIDGLKEWAITKVVTEGVKTIVAMTNPVGGLLKVAETIYKVVTFFMDNFQRIISFAESVFDSVAAIAAGNIAAASKAIEASLSKTIPIILGFLAKLLNLGGVVGKIKKIINKVKKKIQPTIDNIIDWFIKKIKKFKGGKSSVNKDKSKPKKKDVEKSKNKKDHDDKVKKGLDYLHTLEKKESNTNVGLTEKQAQGVAKKTKKKYPIFKSITPVQKGKKWVYDWRASRGEEPGMEVASESKGESFKLEEYNIIFRVPTKSLEPMKNYSNDEVKNDLFIKYKIEYKRQLELQKTEINKMKANYWLNNHQSFIDRREKDKSEGKKYPSGRDPEGDKDIKVVEALLKNDLIKIYIQKSRSNSELKEKYKNLSGREKIDQIQKDANEYAEAYLSGKSVLHNPDQIAGGDPIVSSRYHEWVKLKGEIKSKKDIEDLGILGDSPVNRWIGAQWRSRAKKLNINTRNQINEIKKKENETKKFAANASMNIKITLKNGEVI
ncbi:polymorphic toxin type 15 domain-containing protein [Aureibacter tunicatorum]|uniref:Uncharacterized protein YaaW (UPF0174 family) n=1 Tax=Aureibacter tunicatorum TaxID=866807 RepID=A0AAE3XRD2_9BACT|nr:polymorphic toxin type 15 domain-containing protein [Aureibacter tunicatorum]MDR6241742.1 uncharacterized protein YaaW (UPF0174 family) [Aureibacter tunicatorum]BDD07396.1 hypothetical protein AUTU_48790 [Aureibacter tunicatorum]